MMSLISFRVIMQVKLPSSDVKNIIHSLLVLEYEALPSKAICRACGCENEPIDLDMLKAVTSVVAHKEEHRTS